MKKQKDGEKEYLECHSCQQSYHLNDIRWRCDCGGLLSVERPESLYKNFKKEVFDSRLLSSDPLDQSGVWRFRELILSIPEYDVVTHPEGNTRLYKRSRLCQYAGIDDLYFKHEGENPTGSFKDRGMTVAVSQAKSLGCNLLACASTGNTSASLASYAAQANLRSVVFLPDKFVAKGKLSQAIGYGAQCIGIDGDFDKAMNMVEQLGCEGLVYLVNSLNPFRLEGQKTVIWEALQQLSWESPDWIVVPGGNLGNTSAFGKAILEAKQSGWVKNIPRIACIQAKGASPFYEAFTSGFGSLNPIKPDTIASAIRIGHPVNYEKAKKVIKELSGYVHTVSDDAIWEAKKEIDHSGIGCEPASAATLAGIKELVQRGIIKKNARVLAILTGHILKDSDIILNRCSDRYSRFNGSLAEMRTYLKK